MKLKLYDYQEQGVALELKMQRCINGDSMGAGKTAQAIVAVERAKATPCLIVCPSSMKITWQREIEKFTDLRPLILTDALKATFPYYIGKLNTHDVIITNYESLSKYFVVSLGEKPYRLKNFVFRDVINQIKSVIIDESARVKDPTARQTKIVKGLCTGKQYVFALTGTPVVNDVADIATQIQILGKMKEVAGDRATFMNLYGGGDNLEALQERLKATCYFRRETKDVLKDLPELTRTTVSNAMDEAVRPMYNTCMHDLKAFLMEYKALTEAQARRKMRMKALVKFMNLRVISGMGKVKSAIDFLHDTSEPIIVFAEHKAIVEALKEAFPSEVVTVTGSDSATDKQESIDLFQGGKKRIIVCSIRAAGVGLTLTASHNVVFIELPWTFADLSQCEARAHRNGQKSHVTSWIFINENSIDDRLYDLITSKKSLASKITGAIDNASFEDEASFDELANLIMTEEI